MTISAGLQLLCLMVYASCAHGIMVKYGTKGGPIEPPAPTPTLPAPQPYRVPAPVWEERSNDTPDPNAKWRPQLFVPQPRYTQIAFNMLANQPQTNAQRFVNSYIPNHKPVQVQPVENYFTPAQILSSQSLPGLGIRYFVPAYINRPKINTEHRQEDASQNHINNNEVSDVKDSQDDLQWKYEKENGKRIARNSQETSRHTYQWPLYVRPQHQ